MMVAAKAFRLWLRGRPDGALPDSAPVRIADPACGSTGPAHCVVSTAGDLRGIDADKPRIVRELLSSFSGPTSDREDESGFEPAVCVVAEGAAAEVREGGTPLVEGPSTECGTRDSSAKGPRKRKRCTDEQKYIGFERGVREGEHDGKKKKKARGERGHEGGVSRSGGKEGGEVAHAARKADIVVIDLTSDSSAKKIKKKAKKRQRQGERQAEGSSDCEVRHAATAEKGTRKMEGARGSCISAETSARMERGTDAVCETPSKRGASAAASAAPAAEHEAHRAGRQDGACKVTVEEGNKRTRSKKSKTKKRLCSGRPIPSDRPMERANRKTKVGKESCSGGGGGNSNPFRERDASERVSRTSEGEFNGRSAEGPKKKNSTRQRDELVGLVTARVNDGKGGVTGENPRGNLLPKSKQMRLMDWIANG